MSDNVDDACAYVTVHLWDDVNEISLRLQL